MCGIAGICNFNGNSSEAIEKMTKAIIKRGPDDYGYLYDSNLNVSLGHRRLSIIDLSETGHQPMTSNNERYVIIFNGEIYNCNELNEKLPNNIKNHFKGASDTEVLLETISFIGIPETLKSIRGMFAFAVLDKEEKKIYLARDRAGEKPLYYGFIGHNKETFVFASELKSINQVFTGREKICKDSVELYLRHGYIPQPYTIYEGLFKLPPGNILCITYPFNKIDYLTHYWLLKDKINSENSLHNISLLKAEEKFEALLKEVVREQMITDVPYGAFLSGGIDSSLIVSMMQSISDVPINTFSIGFEEEKYNEAYYAKNVAKHLGCEHTEMYVSNQDAMNVIPLISNIYDEPFADSSQIPTYLVSKLASEKIKVSLSGDGGDELFCGYPSYGHIDRVYNKILNMPKALKKSLLPILRCNKSELIDKLLSKNNFTVRLKNLIQNENQVDFYRNILEYDNGRKKIIKYPKEDILYWLYPQNIELPYYTIIENMQYLDFNMYLVDDILVKVDRAAMYSSLETRVPLLDYRIIEFAFNLPLKYKYNNGISKSIMKNVLYKYVPQELIDRPKKGFAIPLDSWLRKPLLDWANELISSKKLREFEYINWEVINKIWHDFKVGKNNDTSIIWNILILSDWLNKKKNRI